MAILEDLGPTFISITEFIVYFLLFAGIWNIIQAISGGRAGDAVRNLTGRGGGGSTDLTPVMEEIRKINDKIDSGFTEVKDDVRGVGTKIDGIKKVVDGIRADLEKLDNYIKEWAPVFESIENSIKQLQSKIAENKGDIAAVKSIVKQNTDTLKEMEKRCGDFSKGLEILGNQLTDKLNEHDKRFAELSSQIGGLSKDVEDIKNDSDRYDITLKALHEKMDKLPDKLKTELEAEFKQVNDKLIEMKTKVEKLKNINVTKLKKDIEDIVKERAAGVKSHITRKVGGLREGLIKQLKEMMTSIKKLIDGVGDASDITKEVGELNAIVVSSFRDIKNSLTQVQQMFANLENEKKAAEINIKEAAETLTACGALGEDIKNLVEVFTYNYEQIKQRHRNRIKTAMDSVAVEMKYVVRELWEVRQIGGLIKEKNIDKLKISEVRDHLHKMQYFERQEQRQSRDRDVADLKKNIEDVIDLLPQKKVQSILHQIQIFEADTLIGAARNLKKEIGQTSHEKTKADIKWRKVKIDIKAYKKELEIWANNLKLLGKMLKRVRI